MRELRPRLLMLVFGLALVPRVLALWIADRHGISEGYDASTYYLASSALLHGRLPYVGDFTFVHPPGIMLVGLPFALLGHLTTAHVGFFAANLAGCVFGALTALGVTVLARRWGASAQAAVVGGCVVALWSSAVPPESVFKLEPLGDVLFVAVLLAFTPRGALGRRRLVLAGVLVAALVLVKIWWALPIALVVLLIAIRLRRWAVVVVPAVTTMVVAGVVVAPFALAPGNRMFRAIVLVQLHRSPTQLTSGVRHRISIFQRLDEISGVTGAARQFLSPTAVLTDPRVHVASGILCLVVALLAARALTTPLGRLAVPLLAGQLLVVLAVPVFYHFYADYMTVALGLTVAAAVSALSVPGGRPGAAPVALSAVGAVLVAGFLVLTLVDFTTSNQASPVPHRAALAAAARGHGCVVSDSPRVLIVIDAVDQSFTPGCRNWVDIEGIGLGAGPDPRARLLGSSETAAWLSDTWLYLDSGRVLALGDRGVAYRLGPQRMATLTRGRAVVRDGGIAIYGPRSVR